MRGESYSARKCAARPISKLAKTKLNAKEP